MWREAALPWPGATVNMLFTYMNGIGRSAANPVSVIVAVGERWHLERSTGSGPARVGVNNLFTIRRTMGFSAARSPGWSAKFRERRLIDLVVGGLMVVINNPRTTGTGVVLPAQPMEVDSRAGSEVETVPPDHGLTAKSSSWPRPSTGYSMFTTLVCDT